MKTPPFITAQLLAFSILIVTAPMGLPFHPSSLLQSQPQSQDKSSTPECGQDGTTSGQSSTANKLTDESTFSESETASDTPLPLEGAAANVATVEQTKSEEELRRERVQTTLQVYFTRQVDVEVLRPWSIMHGLIAYGRNSQVVVAGKHVNAAEYLAHNGIGNEMRIMYLENGKLKTRIGVGVQGHPGQLLAMFAQSNIPANQPMTVDGKQFTVRDLIEFEKRDCRSGMELTFKLIGLSHYCEPNEVWKNEQGEKWSFPRLIREELAEPVSEGACGGTHRLMALSFAVFQLEKRNMPLAGEWLNAARKLDGYVDRAFSLQNSDGSFSTEFFEKPGAENDRIRRCYSTGHIVEWLAFTLPANKMTDPRLTKAVDYLTELMLSTPNYDLDVGPRGHALHALAMYELKAYGKSSPHDYYQVTGTALPPVLKSDLKFEVPITKPASFTTPSNWSNDPPRFLQGRRRR